MRERFGKSEKGQAAVEFALCLPIVLLILCAIADFGWVFMHELTLSNATREGARVAIINVSDGSYADKARDKVEDTAAICNNGTLSVSVTATGGDVKVTAAYNLQMLTPMAKLIFGGMQYEIQRSCVMHGE